MDFAFQRISELSKGREEALRLLYEKYEEEMKHLPYLEYMNEKKFQSYIGRHLARAKAVAATEAGRIKGVLLYCAREKGGEKYIDIPMYGACPEDADRIVGRLFQYLAQDEAAQGITHFSAHIYAHDAAVRQLFSLMQFGTMAEKCVRKACAHPANSTPYPIQNLTKREIEENWGDIWKLTKAVIDHLKESPVFYQSDAFTEEAYRTFYLEEGTTLYAAYNAAGEMIGIIETNRDENSFVCANAPSVNVGEVYVLPEYRGSGLAQELFCYAENFARNQGAAFLWVEHGTANPNARGFWNKYFDTYQYEMVRQVVL